MIYCLRQKKYTETKNEETIQTKNGRLMMKGICVECGAKKSKFVKSKIGGSFDIHSAIGKLPRPKNGFTPGKYKNSLVGEPSNNSGTFHLPPN